MKVLDLRCGTGHAFEGWFASEDDFQAQRERGLLDCPVCGNADVARLPSAPRLNLSSAKAPAPRADPPPARAPEGTDAKPNPEQAVAHLVEAVKQLLDKTQDVGERFAEEARRIHYGESDLRAIRGRTTPEEREALADEGIEVITLPGALPDKGTLQ